jgi:hypothetical protein
LRSSGQALFACRSSVKYTLSIARTGNLSNADRKGSGFTE